MSLRKAHKLTPPALALKSTKKASVRLATTIFSESTRDALLFYASHEGIDEWSGSEDFIKIVIKL